MLERTFLRIAAVSMILGVIISGVSGAFHGGHQPYDLVVTLPQYATNANWVVVHLGQFLGQFLVVGGLVGLFRSITFGPGAALAQLGFVAAVVAISVYAANQAVDGIAIKFVAEEWVNAPAVQKDVAFRVAEAVRHIEIGLTSLTVLILGVAFILYGEAIELSRVYPRWLGWLIVVDGGLWVIVGIFFAYRGFTPLAITISQGSAIVFVVWALALTVLMWRRASTVAQTVSDGATA